MTAAIDLKSEVAGFQLLEDESPLDSKVALKDIAVVAQIARDRAYAQRLAAAEQKFRLDSEFARMLQDQGNATDGCDADR